MSIPPEFAELEQQIEDQIRQAAQDLLAEVRERYSPEAREAESLLWCFAPQQPDRLADPESRRHARQRIIEELAGDDESFLYTAIRGAGMERIAQELARGAAGEQRKRYERALDDARLPSRISEAVRLNSERAFREGIIRFIADMRECPTERAYRSASTCGGKAMQPDVWIVERDVAWPPEGWRGAIGAVPMDQMAYYSPLLSSLLRDGEAWGAKADVVILDAVVLTGGVPPHVAGSIFGRALIGALGEERCRALSPSALERYAVARAFLLPYPRRHFAKLCRWCGREFDALRYEAFPTFCGRCLAFGYNCLGGTFSLLDSALEGAESDLRYWIENHGMVSASGQNGRVPDAASRVLKHRAPPSRARPQLESNLRAYAEALGFVPPAALSDKRVCAQLDALSGTARDELFAGVIAVTDTSVYKRVYGSWFKALVASGVLEGAERPGVYGTTCLASDGHECRSIAEKTIDDWLTAHGMDHAREPRYPEMSGAESAYLADWRVGDVYIEYLGLTGSPMYDGKTKRKKALAQQAGIEIIWLHPKDLLNLDNALSQLLANLGGQSPSRERER